MLHVLSSAVEKNALRRQLGREWTGDPETILPRFIQSRAPANAFVGYSLSFPKTFQQCRESQSSAPSPLGRLA
jgi:hypothetical protein